jgi:hypothetical protein
MHWFLWLRRRAWWALVGRPRVRLYVRPYRLQTVTAVIPGQAPLGVPFNVFQDRFLALLRLVPGSSRVIVRQCWIDTGAYLTLVPERIWRRLTAHVIWLTAPSGGALPSWLTSVRVAGGLFRVALA